MREGLRDEIFKTRAGGGTAIYDAIYSACAKELSHPPRPPGDQPDVVRRVMILISDGDDNLSTHTRADAIEMAQRTSVVIYTISTSTQWIALSQTDPNKLANRKNHLTEGDQILKDIADDTGGRAFFPYHVDDLDQSFQDIGDELRNQYSIAYNPTNYALDGRYHKIRIEVPDHKGYQVRARRGYFARANAAAGRRSASRRGGSAHGQSAVSVALGGVIAFAGQDFQFVIGGFDFNFAEFSVARSVARVVAQGVLQSELVGNFVKRFLQLFLRTDRNHAPAGLVRQFFCYAGDFRRTAGPRHRGRE